MRIEAKKEWEKKLRNRRKKKKQRDRNTIKEKNVQKARTNDISKELKIQLIRR